MHARLLCLPQKSLFRLFGQALAVFNALFHKRKRECHRDLFHNPTLLSILLDALVAGGGGGGGGGVGGGGGGGGAKRRSLRATIARSILILFRNDANKALALEFGAIDKILTGVERAADDPAVAVEGCGSLVNVALHEENQAHFTSTNALDRILALLDVFSGSSEVRIAEFVCVCVCVCVCVRVCVFGNGIGW